MESVISSLPVKDQFLRKIKCYLFWPVLDQNLNPLLLSSLHKLNHRAFELQLLFSLHPKTEPFNNQLLLKRHMSANIAFHSRKPWNINSGHQYSNKTGRESFGHTSYNSRGWGRGHHFQQKIICQLCGKSGYTVQRCYYRFDISFSGINTSSSNSRQSSDSTNFSPLI